jgi:hypothetical protein
VSAKIVPVRCRPEFVGNLPDWEERRPNEFRAATNGRKHREPVSEDEDEFEGEGDGNDEDDDEDEFEDGLGRGRWRRYARAQ